MLACAAIEIGTTTVTHVLAADSVEERDDWIDTLKRASVRLEHNHKHTGCIIVILIDTTERSEAP